MATCTGEGGGDRDGYRPAEVVLQAHAAHLARLGPTPERVLHLVVIADALAGNPVVGAVRDRDLREATLSGTCPCYVNLPGRRPSITSHLEALTTRPT